MKEHLLAVSRQTGKLPKKLAEIPEMPAELIYLWVWFCELDRSRSNNGFGVTALSNTEMLAWMDLGRIRLTPWEIEVIRRIDAVRIQVSNEK